MASEASPYQLGAFMCTAGRGLEALAAAEIAQRLGATQVETSDGKVFFTAKGDKILELKSVERLFVLVKKIPSVNLPQNIGAGLRIISKRVTANPTLWGDAVMLWKGLQPLQRGHPSDRVSHRKRHTAHRETASRCKMERTSQTLDSQVTPTGMEPLRKRAHKELDLDNSDQERDGPNTQSPVEVRSVSACQTHHGSSEMIRHRVCSPTDVESFRVSFRCSGNNSQHYNSQELVDCGEKCVKMTDIYAEFGRHRSSSAFNSPSLEDLGKAVGIALTTMYGWNTDLRHPQLEVFVHLNDLYCVVAFPVTRFPLSKRSYCVHPGLRSTVAYAMASLAGIQPHAVVMDPMCGVGTLLVETAMAWKTVYCIGTDVDAQQLKQAMQNIRFAELGDRTGLLQASVTALPIPCSCIDVIICDIPFGQKFSNDEEMKNIMPKMLQEMTRVLRVGGNIVLLVSCQMSPRVLTLSQQLCKLCDKNTVPSVKHAANANETVLQDTHDTQAASSKDTPHCAQAEARRRIECKDAPYCSGLVCEGVYPLSLGETDACIHRYKKRLH